MNKVELSAHWEWSDDSKPIEAFRISLTCDTAEEAEEFAALFPKSYKVRTTRVSVLNGDDYYSAYQETWLYSNGVNGGVNEAGVSRIKKTLAKMEKLGIETEWKVCYGNSYKTKEEALAALNK